MPIKPIPTYFALIVPVSEQNMKSTVLGQPSRLRREIKDKERAKFKIIVLLWRVDLRKQLYLKNIIMTTITATKQRTDCRCLCLVT